MKKTLVPFRDTLLPGTVCTTPFSKTAAIFTEEEVGIKRIYLPDYNMDWCRSFGLSKDGELYIAEFIIACMKREIDGNHSHIAYAASEIVRASLLKNKRGFWGTLWARPGETETIDGFLEDIEKIFAVILPVRGKMFEYMAKCGKDYRCTHFGWAGIHGNRNDTPPTRDCILKTKNYR